MKTSLFDHFNTFWMPDQVRHDESGIFCEFIKIDGIIKGRIWLVVVILATREFITIRKDWIPAFAGMTCQVTFYEFVILFYRHC